MDTCVSGKFTVMIHAPRQINKVNIKTNSC